MIKRFFVTALRFAVRLVLTPLLPVIYAMQGKPWRGARARFRFEQLRQRNVEALAAAPSRQARRAMLRRAQRRSLRTTTVAAPGRQ